MTETIKQLRERVLRMDDDAQRMNEQSIFRSVRELNMHPEQGKNDVIRLCAGLHDAAKIIRAQQEQLDRARERLKRIKSHNYGTHNAIEHSKAIWDIATETLAAISDEQEAGEG